MRNDLSQIRGVINDAFSSRSLTSLLALLGFSESSFPLEDASEDIRYCGSRGTLACYCAFSCDDIASTARTLRARNFAQLQLYFFTNADWSTISVASFGLGERLLTLTLQCDRVRASDLETLHEMIPHGEELGTALAARHARALDRSRVTRRFFADFAAQRDNIAAAWIGPSARQQRDREQLALLLLSRMMFLYFLQHRGYLGGDRDYLIKRFRAWTRSKRTFYAGALKPLFFFVLNRRVELRPERAAIYGDLPYLNGGLFERHVLERKHARLDLPDACLKAVFDDLLERYRFTARESSDAQLDGVHDVGVDPEMLGGVFEGLMEERTRETTGTFYTPAATVDRLVCNTLDAYARPGTSRSLREVKVLDPACGSGAFLLGALARISERRAAAEGSDVMSIRRDTVARSLYGVDLQSDAALLCALRLWLALVPGSDHHAVQPLPNLDRKIRQGDSLIDPLDLRAGVNSADVRRSIAALAPASAAYVHSEPDERPTILRALQRSERQLARTWAGAQLARVQYQTAELAALATQKDLFGAVTAEARAARSDLVRVTERSQELKKLTRSIRTKDERPFFSFAVHFPDAALTGFDIILCNPPWVRSHNWPKSLTPLMRGRFAVCRDGNQVDLALLFLERCIDLLAPGGALGIILPAKFMRSLSGGAARRLLLEQTDIVSIEDHSLDQRSIFHADAFAALIVARKRAQSTSPSPSPSPSRIAVKMIRRNATPLAFDVDQTRVSLHDRDPRSPWLIVQPDVHRAIGRMREHPAIGDDSSLQVRRGVVSGANGVLLLERANSKLGGLCEIRADGFATSSTPGDFAGVVEQEAVAPVIMGANVRAWSFARERFLLCRRPDTPKSMPRLARYLTKHGLDLGDVPKTPARSTAVVWHDLASTLKAVVVPADVVALNTVYYIPLPDDDAHLLCAYFNSLPVRTLARAIAERAKDAHFRFFAWTVAMLPLPVGWRTVEAARLREISRCAHAAGAIDDRAQAELDAIVAKAFGLGSADQRALRSFDAWLRGL